ncbi:hypothetical protein ACFLU6_04675 [Acidobacteriota bacterium]
MTAQDTERGAIQAASLARFLMHRKEGIAIISVSLPPPDGWLEDDEVRQHWKDENAHRNIRLYWTVQAAGYRIWRIEATWALGAGGRKSTFIERSFAVIGASRDDVVKWSQAFQEEKALCFDAAGLELLSFDGTRESVDGPITSFGLKIAWKRVRGSTYRHAEIVEFPVIVRLGWSSCLVLGALVDRARKLAEQGLPVDTIADSLLSKVKPVQSNGIP